MGLLRLLLAIGVVTEHAGNSFGAGSYTAVEAFFIISGFYMSLIYGRAYTSTRDFYASRFFRLFPVYWLALVIGAGYLGVAHLFGAEETWFSYLGTASLAPLEVAYLVLANVLMLGSDATWFFPSAFSDSVHAVHFLVVSPIWTLSLELVFYALCPLVLRLRDRWLLLLVCVAFGARVLAYTSGLNDNPWHARFIGFEIAYFLLGVLAHRAYLRGGWWLLPSRSGRAAVVAAATVLVAVEFNRLVAELQLVTLYNRADYVHSLIFYALIVIALPGLYDRTRSSSFDRWLGEHSYPVYVWHYIFVNIFIQSGFYGSPAFVLALTLVHSVLTVHFVQRPIDAMRHRRFRAGNVVEATDAPLRLAPAP